MIPLSSLFPNTRLFGIGIPRRSFFILSTVILRTFAQESGTKQPEGIITERVVPGRLFLTHRQAVRSLDETSAIEWAVTPRIKRTLKALGYDPIPPIEIHVLFEGENYQELEAARYSARWLEVAAPIETEQENISGFSIKRSEPFRCLSLLFSGSPLESTKYWSKLYGEVKTRKLVASGENREIALSRTGFDSSKYITELQLGIKAHN